MSSPIYAAAAELWHAMKADYQDDLERRFREADDATHGYLVTREGRAKYISGHSLFTGSAARADQYASRELKDHWITHPRVTLAQFEREWLQSRGGLEAYVMALTEHHPHPED